MIFRPKFNSVCSQLNCYNEKYNFNEIFEYDNSVILIWAIFGLYMVDSHESDAFGPYFEKIHFLNIQNKQRLYITHSKARHLHLINSQHFFCLCKFEFF